MTNKLIKETLEERIECSLEDFKEIEKPFFLFNELLNYLNNFDFDKFKKDLKAEFINGLELSLERYKDNEQPKINGYLIEHDNHFTSDSWANTYGITLKEEDGDLSTEYTNIFHETVGPMNLTLYFLDQLEKLSDYETKYSNLFNTEVFCNEIDGYDDFISIYFTRGYLAIHEVLTELYNDKFFEKINFEDKFVFLIGQHDMNNEEIIFTNQ